jgi:hypothetical protein
MERIMNKFIFALAFIFGLSVAHADDTMPSTDSTTPQQEQKQPEAPKKLIDDQKTDQSQGDEKGKMEGAQQ